MFARQLLSFVWPEKRKKKSDLPREVLNGIGRNKRILENQRRDRGRGARRSRPILAVRQKKNQTPRSSEVHKSETRTRRKHDTDRGEEAPPLLSSELLPFATKALLNSISATERPPDVTSK